MAVPFYGCRDIAVVGGYIPSRAPLSRARSATRTTMGFPDIRERLPGSRLDAKRAGMMAVKDMRRILGGRLLVHFAYFFLGRQLSRFLLEHSRVYRPESETRVGRPCRRTPPVPCGTPAVPCKSGRRERQAVARSMDAFQYEFRQGGIELGIDAHRNQVAPAEVAAFLPHPFRS